MFIGAAGGIALSHLPGLPMIAGAAMGIGALMVAMLGLPLTSVLVVSVFLQADGLSLMPLVIVAVVVSYIVSARLPRHPALRPTRRQLPSGRRAPRGIADGEIRSLGAPDLVETTPGDLVGRRPLRDRLGLLPRRAVSRIRASSWARPSTGSSSSSARSSSPRRRCFSWSRRAIPVEGSTGGAAQSRSRERSASTSARSTLSGRRWTRPSQQARLGARRFRVDLLPGLRLPRLRRRLRAALLPAAAEAANGGSPPSTCSAASHSGSRQWRPT